MPHSCMNLPRRVDHDPPIRRRIFSLSAGEGDSSMIFGVAVESSIRARRDGRPSRENRQGPELDVPRRLDVLLDVDVAHAEGGLGLCCASDRMGELSGARNDAHPAPRRPPSPGRSPDSDFLAVLSALSSLSIRAVASGKHGDPALFITRRGRFVPHQPDDLRIGADEFDMAGFADLGQVGASRRGTRTRGGWRRRGDLGGR